MSCSGTCVVFHTTPPYPKELLPMSLFSRTPFILTVGLAATLLAGCNTTPESHSEIVKQFKAAGGGDPDKADAQGISVFLSQRLPLDKQLAPECVERAKTADSNWTSTGEGKVCVTASQIVATANFFAAPAAFVNNDQRTFSAVPPGYEKLKK